MKDRDPLHPPPPINVPGLPDRRPWFRRLPRPLLLGVPALGLLVLALLPVGALARYTTSAPDFCLTCHATGDTPDRGVRSLVHPGYGRVSCVDCHAKPGQVVFEGYVHGFAAEPERVSPACERCHGDARSRTDQEGFRFNFANIRIDHSKHLALGAQCVTCHVNVAHDLRSPPTNRPRMEYCYSCHSREESCTKCHQGALPTAPPPFAASTMGATLPDGRLLFLRECSGCHGARGDTLHQANLTSAQGLADEAAGKWRRAIAEGQGEMPPMVKARGGPLTDDQVTAVLAFLKLQAETAAAGPADAPALYASHCLTCHGADGSKVAAAPLSQAPFWQGRSDDEVRSTIRVGRGGMPGFGTQHGGPLKPGEVEALAKFVRAMGVEKAGAARLDGAGLYARNCGACHGADGKGLPGADLGSKEFLNAKGTAGLIEATRDGRGGMPAMGKAKGGQLSDEEIAAIVEHLLAR